MASFVISSHSQGKQILGIISARDRSEALEAFFREVSEAPATTIVRLRMDREVIAACEVLPKDTRR